MLGVTRISKKEFYRNGGLANTKHYRKQIGGAWAYFLMR